MQQNIFLTGSWFSYSYNVIKVGSTLKTTSVAILEYKAKEPGYSPWYALAKNSLPLLRG
ncbi:hypothetical protein [Sphaerochaeta globosa]|uniref:hypothetical protein n=1 Tax=Sphaerochaeta globosa TaxID=1131703 RepID=UPI0012DCEB19|nr:hypothetical protein [Sphaerochaeta globosa]